MSTEVTMTGSGTVGPVSSWSFTEGSSPAVPNAPTPNVGTLTLTAAATEDSKFVINNAITVESDDIGSVEGVASSVSVGYTAATLNVTSALQRFNADFTIFPVTGGTLRQATDLLMQLSGSQYCNLTYQSGRYWSLQGHSQGFDFQGNPVVYADNTQYNASEYYSTVTAQMEPYVAGDIQMDGGLFAAGGFSFTRNRYYATAPVLGNGINLSPGQNPIIALKFDPAISSTIVVAGGPDDSNLSTGFYLACGYSQPNDRLEINGYARIGGINTSVNVNGSTTGFSAIDDMQMVVYPRFTDANTLEIDLYVVSTDDYSTVESLSTTVSTVLPDYFTPWSATGRVRAVYQCDEGSDITSTLTDADYEVSDFGYTSTSASSTNGAGSVIDGARMNGWEYLNQVATARSCEIAVSGSTIVLRGRGELGEVEVPIEAAESIEVSSQSPGLSVDVRYTGASLFGTTGSAPSNPMPPISADIYPMQCVNLYDALQNDQKWTVNAGQSVTVRVEVDSASAVFVGNPRPSIYWDDPDQFLAQKGVTEFGTYVVSGSDNLPIPGEEWLAFGGSVTARPTDDPGIVELTFVGPAEVPGVPDPFSFSVSDGATDYPALTIPGRGVSVSPQTLNILTGAAGTTVAVASTVDNIAVATAEQAHDVGSWAAALASGSWQTVRLTVPTVNLIAWDYTPPTTLSRLGAFGYSAGSLFRIGDAILRVDSATIGKTSSTIEASFYTTFADLDAVWAGETIGDFDTTWATYDFGDIKIAPLRT
jgi:hypothetical protein